jgi:ketosteroid isomerase-like protein
MSEENVELVRRLYGAWNPGDMVALTNVFDPEVEVRPALSAFLASTIYRGHEGVAAWYAETREPWAALHAEPHRVLDAGERTVVLVGSRARVPGGQVDVDAEIARVLTIRDGRIVRLDGYEDPEAALAAAGLRE